MDTAARARTGPYHPGEVEVQRRAGVREDADRVGRIVGAVLSATAGRALADLPLAVAASLDEGGRVWASLLAGPSGFLRRVDDKLLLVECLPSPADPLARNLGARAELGLLAIDLATRRRLRLNGRALLDPERGIFLAVEQAYGNCPKYIQARRLDPPEASLAAPVPPERSPVLTRRQQALVAGADTFFIASFHPEGGADASHRGGAPGFVRILDDRTLAFPDYPGNNMFNTLGNLAVQPRAGLLFLDFASGDTLQLTGRARLDRDPAAVAAFRGARHLVVNFAVDEALETRGAGVRGRLLEYSPANP
ncbi:MAG TPA: pyridoxamine 5'-phosphate oxidase family protein [Vicinamibacteria bacterium]|nr:pyridoxamine 5'-phosphate oxidase family protein [Vicinamibacteria bacterium]